MLTCFGNWRISLKIFNWYSLPLPWCAVCQIKIQSRCSAFCVLCNYFLLLSCHVQVKWPLQMHPLFIWTNNGADRLWKKIKPKKTCTICKFQARGKLSDGRATILTYFTQRCANHASKTSLETDFGALESRFCPSRQNIFMTSAWHQQVGPWYDGWRGGWRQQVWRWRGGTVKGHSGGDVARWLCRRLTQAGDVTGWRRFPVLGAPPLGTSGFGGGSPPCLGRWRMAGVRWEYRPSPRC